MQGIGLQVISTVYTPSPQVSTKQWHDNKQKIIGNLLSIYRVVDKILLELGKYPPLLLTIGYSEIWLGAVTH